jgi:hypothetical protein
MSEIKLIIKWEDNPKEHNYPAALSYLSLIYPPKQAALIVGALKLASTTKFKAKDVIRASGFTLLNAENKHVKANKEKIKSEIALSPVLLVRDSTTHKLLIADGFHRVSTVYLLDEDADIFVHIVSDTDKA